MGIVWCHEPGNPRSLGSSYVHTLHVDRRGTLWVGTIGGGLNRYDPLTEDSVRFPHQTGDPESLAADEVSSICEDGTGGARSDVILSCDCNTRGQVLREGGVSRRCR
ncbi:MAG: two-component regulator propeller domain-containing protein [Vicinamibacteria bacterium]